MCSSDLDALHLSIIISSSLVIWSFRAASPALFSLVLDFHGGTGAFFILFGFGLFCFIVADLILVVWVNKTGCSCLMSHVLDGAHVFCGQNHTRRGFGSDGV